jgi:hypothetical protein
MRALALCGAVYFSFISLASAYTQADASACTPDALRLCAAYIPNAKAIEGCLRTNRARLSSDVLLYSNPQR